MKSALPSRLALPEFVALMAMLTAIGALSIDAMLPALPEIVQELSPGDPNRAQLIVTSFALGMGLGTFVVGPLSDTFGRRPIILLGSLIYSICAFTAWQATTLEGMLLGRVLQGVGAAGPRVVALAMIRDLHVGRRMAQIMSFVMMIFAVVPAVAPMMGNIIIITTGWRAIFPAFILFAILAIIWLYVRQPETLPVEHRRPLNPGRLWQGMTEVLRMRVAQVSILIQGMVQTMLFATLSQIQQIFDDIFDRAASFPYWFAAIAAFSMVANLANARLVMHWGMRQLIQLALLAQFTLSLIVFIASVWGGLPPPLDFALFMLWAGGVFAMMGFTMGNINAIAMEPLGHMAGMAASVISALATVIGASLAAVLGQTFDGTLTPLTAGVAMLAVVAMIIRRWLPPAPQRAAPD